MPVRRIADNHVDAAGCKHLIGALDRQGVDAHDVRQSVELHTAPRHVRHIRLNFKRIDALSAPHARQQQRQNARPRAEIGAAVAVFRSHEAGQQHSIHAEAEALLLLQDAQTRLLQFVDALTGQHFRLISGILHVCHCVRPLSIDFRLIYGCSQESSSAWR